MGKARNIAGMWVVAFLCAAQAEAAQLELKDSLNRSSGWIVDYDASAVAIAVDSLTFDGSQPKVLTLSITQTLGPASPGENPSLSITFLQDTPDDTKTASRIVLASQNITNDTGTTWAEYSWQFFYSATAKFNKTASAWNTAPLTAQTWGGLSGDLADSLTASGGTIPDDSDAMPDFTPSGSLVIDVNMAPMYSDFGLKQLVSPVPEPATAAALLCGGIVAWVRRRR